jgi:hypothetical protein
MEKAADRKAGTAASMAEMRGDGGPPDGHDPEALPRSTPLLANLIRTVVIASCLIVVQVQLSNRRAIFRTGAILC